MDTVTLQVPMSRKLRDMATKAALDQGVSSLQEAIRIFTTRLAKKQTTISLDQYPSVKISSKNDKKYSKIVDDYFTGKPGFTSANSVEELMYQLHENK